MEETLADEDMDFPTQEPSVGNSPEGRGSLGYKRKGRRKGAPIAWGHSPNRQVAVSWPPQKLTLVEGGGGVTISSLRACNFL